MSDQSRESLRKYCTQQLQIIDKDNTPRCHDCKRKIKLPKKPDREAEKNEFIFKFFTTRCYNCSNINFFAVKYNKGEL